MDEGVSITFSGPLFDGEAVAQVRPMITEITKQVGDEGVRMIREHLDGVLKTQPTGAEVASIAVEGEGENATIHGDRIVYGAWLEGVGSRNATTRFPGYHTFREVTAQIDAKAAEVAHTVVPRYVARMN